MRMRQPCHQTPNHLRDNNSTKYAHNLIEQQTNPDLTTHLRRQIRRKTVVTQSNDVDKFLHDMAVYNI